VMLLRRGCRSERKQQQHERAWHSLYQRDVEWRSVPLAVRHCVDEQLLRVRVAASRACHNVAIQARAATQNSHTAHRTLN
jgi:hypothetical protein